MTVVKLLDPHRHHSIVEGAAPVEFLLERVRGPNSTTNQSEVPRDIASFPAFIRGCMRREPTDIIVGECRDGETMSAAAQASISGHTLTTTTHANDVALTIQRICSLCPVDERDNLVSAIAQSLRLVINQRLVPSTDGRRTALREFLAFDTALRDRLLQAAPRDWPGLTRRAVAEQGQSYAAAIDIALAQGQGFALDIVRDPEALLGYRLRATHEGCFSTVMLSTMEAVAQVAQPGVIVVNDLNALWSAAVRSLERQASPAPSVGRGPSP